ncbi:hypothetical protein AMRN_2751 [Malaciobacter marinus]|jgi:adenylosuccinate lyase|uniref:Uncharacterized protein n=1 Tax=Malaciobacter marinus TaxID=505249 RepID=A0A347TPC1_9BACT|nr:hypothetical protein [Malaciobacter marinus]AXX88449.1 hypothetical protein AMRN_2751 [Malaciobacter marinus]PHO13463.1 hypothetical protein CPG38_03135 [Malaciobacter marinus]PHO14375.1 hypothetical protein CPH92_12190 [Malaciobacter marinus]
MNFTKSITNNIDKLVGTLKSEDELQEVLKRKFTKKEFKVFVAIESGQSIEDLKRSMKDDEERIEEIYKTACKKLNQELFKKELVSIN